MKNQLGEINKAILEALPIGALWISEAGEIIYANPVAAATLGVPDSQLIGQRADATDWQVQDLRGNRVVELDFLCQTFLKRGEPLPAVRYTLRRPDGKYFYLTTKFAPLFESGSPRGILCILDPVAHDSSRHAPLHAPPDSETLPLEEAVKRTSIGRLAGGVAHNLNNILSPVIGFSDMALASVQDSDPLYSQLIDIRSATERATTLVRQLLAFARRQSFELQPIDLSKAIADLEEILQQSIPKGIELDLSGCTASEPVIADVSQVQQILIELVLNATEAMDQRGQIVVATEALCVDDANRSHHPDVQHGHYVMLTVRDTGRGMDEEILSRVFDPFFTTKEVGEGSGLGLSTVYGIVKQHGGTITVDSCPGKGSTFHVYLPRKKDTKIPPPRRKSEPGVPRIDETILVVEDEDSLLKFTSIVLKKFGYTVLEASAGTEALDIVRSHTGPIHLLLTDVIMPGMNGKEIYKVAQKLKPDMKILYTTGYPDDVIARDGIVDKGENLLPKPTTVDKLTTKVREVLDEE